MILVCDVGGTRTRLALAASVNGAWTLSDLEESPTTPDVTAKVARIVAGKGVTAAAFGGAGPNEADGSIRLTNAGVFLDPAALAKGCRRLPDRRHQRLSRDCRGDSLSAENVAPALRRRRDGLRRAHRRDGTRTGLGVAIGVTGPGGWHAIQGEGGHADLAPVDDEELEVWQKLRHAHGRLSVETVLCGPGLERLLCRNRRTLAFTAGNRRRRPARRAGTRCRAMRSSRAG
jgi:glucokinase